MVILHIKRGTESQFLYETTVAATVSQVVKDIVFIYNGRLKISRICGEIEELIKYGPMFPPEILGLTDEQVQELKLTDAWETKVEPSGGWAYNRDPIGRRNGRQPCAAMQDILRRSINDVKEMVSKKLTETNKALTIKQVQEALALLKGAVTIVYPMQLPPHDVIRMELTNTEDLCETQASREVIELAKAQLWFAGRQMLDGKHLHEYVGRIEKCKVIVKLVKCGEGAPGREPGLSEETRKQLMLQQYRRQEELKRLEDNDDDQYLNSNWADNSHMKRQLQGVQDVQYRYGT